MREPYQPRAGVMSSMAAGIALAAHEGKKTPAGKKKFEFKSQTDYPSKDRSYLEKMLFGDNDYASLADA